MGLRERLRTLFAVEEIEADARLRMVCAALLLYSYLTFTYWYDHPGVSMLGTQSLNYAPPPILEDAPRLIFLGPAWTNAYFFLLQMLALLGVFLLYAVDGLWPMLILAFEALNVAFYFLSDLRLMTSYHYMHLLLTVTFLLSTSKLFFLRMALLTLYLLSAFAKLNPSWLYGEYFNSVPGKLPLLPKANWIVTFAGNALISLEAFGPWLWFSRNRALRSASVCLLALFHLYSGLIVWIRYPTLMLPVLIASFLKFDQPIHRRYHFSKRHLLPWIFLASATLGGLVHFLIPGDARLTGEGRYLGLFMFDANRFTTFQVRIVKGPKEFRFTTEIPWQHGAILEDGTVEEYSKSRAWVEAYDSGSLKGRTEVTTVVRDGATVIFNPDLFTQMRALRAAGDPYLFYFYARELCRRYNPDRLSLKLYQQLNGRKEKIKVLDLPDFCRLNPKYRLFRHNDWILPESI